MARPVIYTGQRSCTGNLGRPHCFDSLHLDCPLLNHGRRPESRLAPLYMPSLVACINLKMWRALDSSLADFESARYCPTTAAAAHDPSESPAFPHCAVPSGSTALYPYHVHQTTTIECEGGHRSISRPGCYTTLIQRIQRPGMATIRTSTWQTPWLAYMALGLLKIILT